MQSGNGRGRWRELPLLAVVYIHVHRLWMDGKGKRRRGWRPPSAAGGGVARRGSLARGSAGRSGGAPEQELPPWGMMNVVTFDGKEN